MIYYKFVYILHISNKTIDIDNFLKMVIINQLSDLKRLLDLIGILLICKPIC